MTSCAVVFAPESEDQLAELYRYIATQASPATAERYTDAVIAYCESLSTFPHRGARRDDIRPGLRITHHKGRTVVAFDVDDALLRVSILGRPGPARTPPRVRVARALRAVREVCSLSPPDKAHIMLY